jgi:hypothetical protein
MGRDSASSAQSKRAVDGETARLGLNWGELGARGGQGAFTGTDGVVGDAGRVYHTVGGETARFRGVWAKLSGWGAFQGCSSGSRYEPRRS